MTAFSIDGLFAVIAGMSFISLLYFGIYILLLAPREKAHMIFFLFCEAAALWSLVYVAYYLSSGYYLKDILIRFIYAGMISTFLLLTFILAYTDNIKKIKRPGFIIPALFIPHLVYAYKSISENSIAADFPTGFWFWYMEITVFTYNVVSLAILVIYYFRHTNNKRKRQSLIIIVSSITIMAGGWGIDYILGFRDMINITPFWCTLWAVVVFYLIRKYRFISITPGFINTDISENIEEGIILTDPDLHVVFYNRALSEMLNLKNNGRMELRDIVSERDILDRELSGLKNGGGTFFTARINLIHQDTKKNILADIKIKKIIDAYRDVSGFLAIITRVKGLEELKSLFRISSRELDVIHQIVAGSTNREIGEMLGVTESTVKSHIMNIYNKLMIKNRVELIRLLSEFNIMITAKI